MICFIGGLAKCCKRQAVDARKRKKFHNISAQEFRRIFQLQNPWASKTIVKLRCDHGMKQACLTSNKSKIYNDFITSCFYMKNAHKRQELTFPLRFSGLFSPFRLNSLAEDCEE